jgi:hypothetical protein
VKLSPTTGAVQLVRVGCPWPGRRCGRGALARRAPSGWVRCRADGRGWCGASWCRGGRGEAGGGYCDDGDCRDRDGGEGRWPEEPVSARSEVAPDDGRRTGAALRPRAGCHGRARCRGGSLECVVDQCRVFPPKVRCRPSRGWRFEVAVRRCLPYRYGLLVRAEPAGGVAIALRAGGRGAGGWAEPVLFGVGGRRVGSRFGRVGARFGREAADRDELVLGLEPLAWSQRNHVAGAGRAGPTVEVLIVPCHK